MTRVGFLGLGEAGSLIAADLAAAGAEVRGWDPVVHECEGVEVTAAAAEVAQGARVVVSVNSATDAMDAARAVAGALGPGQLFADFNTSAPGRKREVAAAIAPTGAAFADVALLQSVPGRGLKTPTLASGPGAAADAGTLDHLVAGSRRHAVRRHDEMAAAVAMLDELGVAPRVAAASEAWLGELAASR